MAKATAIRNDESSTHMRKRQHSSSDKQSAKSRAEQPAIVTIQNQFGNAAVQRLLAQRSGNGPTELDDDTATRINSARDGGQALDSSVQTQMSAVMGNNFSGVRVHTGNEANELNQQLGAKAFTTGQDVFFRDGAYDPHSSSGQELIAHELTHVVQQGSGAVPSSGKMAVNAPGDQFEQEADAVAKTVSGANAIPAVQRQELPEEEEMPPGAQRQEEELPEEDLGADMEELPEEDEGE